MQQDLQFYLRITQALVAILTLGLNSSVIQFFSTHSNLPPAPSSLIYLIFTSTFTLLLALPYTTFAPHYFRHIITPYTSLATESLTTIFWFAGWVSGAVYLGHLSACAGTVCHSARAGVAFAALEWLLWCVTLFFPVRHLLTERRGAGSEEAQAGVVGSGYREMSLAQKLKGWRLRREATGSAFYNGNTPQNQHQFRTGGEEQHEGGGGMAQRFRHGLEGFKVRSGNVFGGNGRSREKELESGRGSMV